MEVVNNSAIEDVKWNDIEAEGSTNIGKAIKLLHSDIEKLSIENSLYPEIVIVSDGTPTDFGDWEDEVNNLLKHNIAKYANYHAMFIGDDDGAVFLNKFLKKINSTRNNKLFRAYNTMYIKDFFNNLEIKIKKEI